MSCRSGSGKNLLASLTLASAFIFTSAAPSAAFTDCEAQDRKLAGAYELIDVHETGSIIYLLADGRFGYELTVGAYDEAARGCWTRSSSTVILSVSEMHVNHGDGKFEKLSLKFKANGKLVRKHKRKKWGTYQRVVKF